MNEVPRTGTIEVLLVLKQVAIDHGYKVAEQRLVRREGSDLYVRVLPDGRPALTLKHPVHGTGVRLIPERTYGGGEGLTSISYRQRPDVAIEVEAPGQRVRVYLFDPKYKLWGEVLAGESNAKIFDAFSESGYEEIGELDDGSEGAKEGTKVGGKPMKLDIDKMHAYRDAIRDKSGQRVVVYAAVLYPGQYVGYAGQIEALPAVPGKEAELRARLEIALSDALRPKE